MRQSAKETAERILAAYNDRYIPAFIRPLYDALDHEQQLDFLSVAWSWGIDGKPDGTQPTRADYEQLLKDTKSGKTRKELKK